MIAFLATIASLLSFRIRTCTSLELEMIALRHQLSVLKRQRPGRVRFFCADRLLWILLYRIWPQAINPMILSNLRRRCNGIVMASGSHLAVEIKDR
jgi:putative transposase